MKRAASTTSSGDLVRDGKKSRKAVEPVAVDSRFTFSVEDLADDEDNVPPTTLEADTDEDDHVEDDEDEEEGDALAGPSTTRVEENNSNPLPAHLLPSKKSRGTPGLIYISKLPPGMGPSKAKSLMSQYGEVNRVYLARSHPDPPQTTKKRNVEKHKEHKFKEGWVEFEDKRVARSVAEMLNGNNIGGKKGARWRDDIWTMKYLPRFRWDMLSEQIALERATQTSLLRFHLQNTRTEQESYLQAVEKGRVKTAMDLKAETRKEGKRAKGETIAEGTMAATKKPERQRSYKQREVVGGKVAKGDLDGVLSRLF